MTFIYIKTHTVAPELVFQFLIRYQSQVLFVENGWNHKHNAAAMSPGLLAAIFEGVFGLMEMHAHVWNAICSLILNDVNIVNDNGETMTDSREIKSLKYTIQTRIKQLKFDLQAQKTLLEELTSPTVGGRPDRRQANAAVGRMSLFIWTEAGSQLELSFNTLTEQPSWLLVCEVAVTEWFHSKEQITQLRQSMGLHQHEAVFTCFSRYVGTLAWFCAYTWRPVYLWGPQIWSPVAQTHFEAGNSV